MLKYKAMIKLPRREKVNKIKYMVSKVLSVLTIFSFVWLIVESILIEILNFGLFDNLNPYFDSLVFSLILVPILLVYNWLAFGTLTVWIEQRSPNEPDNT